MDDIELSDWTNKTIIDIPPIVPDPLINVGLHNDDMHWKLLHFVSNNTLSMLQLEDEQIYVFRDFLNWKKLSSLNLSGPLFVACADNINWNIFIKNNYKKDINYLKHVKKYVIDHKHLFDSNEIKKMYYTIEFIDIFLEIIDWKWVGKNIVLNEYHLLKFWNNIPIDIISQYQNLTFNIAQKKINNINWGIACKYKQFTDDIINIIKNIVNWFDICRYQKLNIDQLEKYKNYINYKCISQYQQLSENYILQYKGKLDMSLVSQYQFMSFEVLKKLTDYIKFDKLLLNTNYNKPNSTQVLKNSYYYFIVEPPSIYNMENVTFIQMCVEIDEDC